MRIVSYNILNGGRGREERIADVLRRQRPDVVTLVEADDAEVVALLADRLGMHHVHAPSGGHHAGAILSRGPITAWVNHAGLGKGHWMNAFVEAEVRDPSGGDVWRIAALHFAAHASEEREQLREAQLDSLLERLAHLRDQPHVLAGDFNANAPSQRILPERCVPRTRGEWTENGGDLPRRVVRRLLDAGYVDTLHQTHPDTANVSGTYTTDFPGQRIDYIFTRKIHPARIRDAWIEQTPPAAEASDHFSIGAELAEFSGQAPPQ